MVQSVYKDLTINKVKGDTFEQLRDRVLARRSYGLRDERVDYAYGRMLLWSNASASWFVSGRTFRKGDMVRLDANQIIGYGTIAHLKELALQLPQLPLYSNSFEAVYGPR